MTARLEGLIDRFELSPGGQAAISALIAFILICVLAINLPATGSLHARMARVANPFANAVGLDQNWGVFAPDPRRSTIAMEGKVTFADGHSATWRPPRWNPVFGAYEDHRWAKWLENVIQDQHEGDLWPPTATYVMRQLTHKGQRPVSVTLSRTYTNLRPPGSGPDQDPPQTTQFYSTPVTPQMLKSAGL